MSMEEFEKSPQETGAHDDGPSDSGPSNPGPSDMRQSDAGPSDAGPNQRPMMAGSGPASADELARRRRRGGQRFGAPQRGPMPPRPFAPRGNVPLRGPMAPRPIAPRDDEENSQARELAN